MSSSTFSFSLRNVAGLLEAEGVDPEARKPALVVGADGDLLEPQDAEWTHGGDHTPARAAAAKGWATPGADAKWTQCRSS